MYTVLVFGTDRCLAGKVDSILTNAGLASVHCYSRFEFEDRAAGHRAAVLIAPELNLDNWVNWLDALAEQFPTLRTVLLTDQAPGNLCLLASIKVFHALPLDDIVTLPNVLRTTPFDDLSARMASRLRSWPDMPVRLRRDLLLLLRQIPAAVPVDRHAEDALPHSIVDLARRSQCSPAYLRNLASNCNFPLGRFVHGWLTIRGLELMLTHNVKPEQVAWRLGYASASGFSDLCAHHLGSRPGLVAWRDVRRVLTAFEASIAHTGSRKRSDKTRRPIQFSESPASMPRLPYSPFWPKKPWRTWEVSARFNPLWRSRCDSDVWATSCWHV